jgi:predicted amidohydrolase YtcJ
MSELVIQNGHILTMNSGQPRAQALLISNDRIVAVGSNAQIQDLAPANARRIDAQGGTVLPGFTEAHLHLFLGAYNRRFLQLHGVRGLESLRAKIKAYADQNADEALLICKAASYELFGEGVSTTRQMLDAVLPYRPIILFAEDHHIGWANTIALKKAGILSGLEGPSRDLVIMGDDGFASGELREMAGKAPVMALRSSGGRELMGLRGQDPDATTQERAGDAEVLSDGLKHCASLGFTSIHNMDGNRYQLELLAALEAQDALLCRTEIPFQFTPEMPHDVLDDAAVRAKEFNTERLSANRVKVFMDGVIDGSTAFLLDDYSDQPGWRGEGMHSAERFNAAAIKADALGLQISVHAIGDAAVRRVLDGYKAARDANGARDARHRIEHAELVHPDDLRRFADLGVIASMQPAVAPGSGYTPKEPFLSRIGKDRWRSAFPVADLRASGAALAFSSDWPVSDPDPLKAIKETVTRKAWADGVPNQASTLHEALYGYTLGGAFAGHKDHCLGRLAVGYLADVVVLDVDLEAIPVEEIDQYGAAYTISGGKITWQG